MERRELTRNILLIVEIRLKLLVHEVRLVLADVAEHLDGRCPAATDLLVQVQPSLELLIIATRKAVEDDSQHTAVLDALGSALPLVCPPRLVGITLVF